MDYRIVLLDSNGYDLGEREATNLREAKQLAKYLLSDQYANTCESSHDDMGTDKVEIRNDSGECVFDIFRK